MALQAESMVDRRRLKRRLSLWRLLAVVAGIALIAVLVLRDDSIAVSYRPHIARVAVTGIIRDDRKQLELLADIAKARQVRAVVIWVNSPGGTTTGGESLFMAIRDLAEKKPVVAVFGTIATSAAYLVGIATDHVVARGNTITGSVGVILQWAEVSELLQKLGIKMEEVRSGPLKAVPSPFEPLDEKGRQLAREMVEEGEQWFRGVVAKRRSINPANVPGLIEGRIYSGRQALAYKLIDQIGGEKDAIDWLEKNRQVPKDMTIFDWKTKEDEGPFWWRSAARALARLTGLGGGELAGLLAPARAWRGVLLDGLVSLWHPPKEE